MTEESLASAAVEHVLDSYVLVEDQLFCFVWYTFFYSDLCLSQKKFLTF